MGRVMQSVTPDRERMRAANRRTGLILASIAIVFFFGIMLRYWLMR